MFGQKKLYKKGITDAMQAYEGFGEKQTDALKKIIEKFHDNNKRVSIRLDGFGEEINSIYNYLTSQEKAMLYSLNGTSVDLQDLATEEKTLLLAVLYQLAADEGDALTEDQRAFLRSVQRYLGVTNPQMTVNLDAVENIDSLETQKAFLRVVLEFFYLQDGEALSGTQEDFLSYFSVNKKQAAQIEQEVSLLFSLVGAKGIAEKYGYVPEPEAAETDMAGDPSAQSEEVPIGDVIDCGSGAGAELSAGGMEEITLSGIMQIKEGETRAYRNKVIHVQAVIDCAGTLSFDGCIIHFREPGTPCGITLSKTASFQMEGCRVETHSVDKSMLIKAGKMESPILIKECELKGCCYFVGTLEGALDVALENCIIVNAGINFIATSGYYGGNCKIDGCRFVFTNGPFKKEEGTKLDDSIILGDKILLTECTIKGTYLLPNERQEIEEDKSIGYGRFIDSRKAEIKHSEFRGLSECIRIKGGSICLSSFYHCKDIETRGTTIEDCRFDYCTNLQISVCNTVMGCQFNNILGEIASSSYIYGGSNFLYCEFNNWAPGPESGYLETLDKLVEATAKDPQDAARIIQDAIPE